MAAGQGEFEIEIRTPAAQVVAAKVTEVVVPSYDGERGVLAGHEHFIGLLGTGPLKIVRDGDDFWFVVSGGLYEVKANKLIVLTEFAQDARDVDVETARLRLSELEKGAGTDGSSTQDPAALKRATELKREQAKLDVHRRTALVN
jgi:F-type H+-transporting ATPase subunit epsilon